MPVTAAACQPNSSGIAQMPKRKIKNTPYRKIQVTQTWRRYNRKSNRGNISRADEKFPTIAPTQAAIPAAADVPRATGLNNVQTMNKLMGMRKVFVPQDT